MKHLQRKKCRGYRVHQQPGATLGQKPSKDGAWGKVYSTGSDYCMLIFHFVHSLNTPSFKMVTDYMQRGRKDIFLNKPFILIAFVDNNVWKRKKSLTYFSRTLWYIQKSPEAIVKIKIHKEACFVIQKALLEDILAETVYHLCLHSGK